MFRARKRTATKLDRAYRESLYLPFDQRRDRAIVFSDLHMADRTSVDDFLRNEMIYCHALQQYDNLGFRLILNGDVEEGWEAKAKVIGDSYRDTAYAMERKFADRGQPWHVRIVGNHDSLWSKQQRVEKYLWRVLGPVRVWPGVRLGEDIFISHGHQGDPFSDTLAYISAFSVRHGWRWVQRGLKMSNVRTSNNHLIRKRRDEALYAWAQSRGKLLIAGHTHRSMFGDVPEPNQLVALLRRLESELPMSPEPFQVRATIEYLRKTIEKLDISGSSGEPLPCYFNGGSCVHTDGITGIEIDRGQIRLVKWELVGTMPEGESPPSSGEMMLRIERKVYREADLLDITARIHQGTRGRRLDPLTGNRVHEPDEPKDQVEAAA